MAGEPRSISPQVWGAGGAIPLPEPVSRFISVGGLRLHYLEWGREGTQTMVLLHDLGESADEWRPVAAGLAEEFRVLAVDLRGHGDSDWIDTYALQEIGDDVGEMVTVLGTAPAALLGLGLGGHAAALLAARQEHIVDRAVVAGAGVRMYTPAEREACEAIFAMPRVYDSPEEYATAWSDLRAAAGLRRHTTPGAGALSPERLLRRLAAGGWAPKFDVDGYQRYRAWSPGDRVVDYHDEFAEITSPILLVRGADDTLLTPEEAALTASVIPGCRTATVPDARHDLLADNPAGLLAVALPFLRGDGDSD